MYVPASTHRPDSATDVAPLLDFLDFIEQGGSVPLPRLLERVLRRARQLTDAEAGSVFLQKRVAGRKVLEPGSIQNDVIGVAPQNFVIPITRQSIAGYVASTRETLVANAMDNPAEMAEIARRGSAFAERAFGWDAIVASLSDVYKSAVASRLQSHSGGSERSKA